MKQKILISILILGALTMSGCGTEEIYPQEVKLRAPTIGERVEMLEQQAVTVKLTKPIIKKMCNLDFSKCYPIATTTEKQITTQEFLQLLADQYKYEEATTVEKPARLIK